MDSPLVQLRYIFIVCSCCPLVCPMDSPLIVQTFCFERDQFELGFVLNGVGRTEHGQQLLKSELVMDWTFIILVLIRAGYGLKPAH